MSGSKKFASLLVLIVVVGCAMAFFLRAGTVSTVALVPPEKHSSLTIDGNTILVEIVDTSESRSLGLGGRNGLAEDSGMLFVFPSEAQQGFWMKDMLFPIDILWIDGAHVIVHIEENVLPDTFPNVYEPTTPAKYVLELKSGYSRRHQIHVGSKMEL